MEDNEKSDEGWIPEGDPEYNQNDNNEANGQPGDKEGEIWVDLNESNNSSELIQTINNIRDEMVSIK